jgi:hypothetical protein
MIFLPKPWQAVEIPKDFANQPTLSTGDLSEVLMGPFSVIWMRGELWSHEILDNWENSPADVCDYIEASDHTPGIWSWWNEREHILEVNFPPYFLSNTLVIPCGTEVNGQPSIVVCFRPIDQTN